VKFNIFCIIKNIDYSVVRFLFRWNRNYGGEDFFAIFYGFLLLHRWQITDTEILPSRRQQPTRWSGRKGKLHL